MRTGIILNNQRRYDQFSGAKDKDCNPLHPTNFITPRTIPISSVSHSIFVDKQKNVRLMLGSAGGTKIIPIVTQVELLILIYNFLNTELITFMMCINKILSTINGIINFWIMLSKRDNPKPLFLKYFCYVHLIPGIEGVWCRRRVERIRDIHSERECEKGRKTTGRVIYSVQHGDYLYSLTSHAILSRFLIVVGEGRHLLVECLLTLCLFIGKHFVSVILLFQ